VLEMLVCLKMVAWKSGDTELPDGFNLEKRTSLRGQHMGRISRMDMYMQTIRVIFTISLLSILAGCTEVSPKAVDKDAAEVVERNNQPSQNEGSDESVIVVVEYLDNTNFEEIAAGLHNNNRFYRLDPAISDWRAIKNGVSEEEVIRRIGDPIFKSIIGVEVNDGEMKNIEKWTYGEINSDSAIFSTWGYESYLEVVDAKVVGKRDPFAVGKVPIPVQPQDNIIFSSNVQVVDLRWIPIFHEYPVYYEVDIDRQILFSDEGLKWTSDGRYIANIPMLTLSRSASTHNSHLRWRVRSHFSGENSRWSEFVYFGISGR